jgi:hypothetical protein
MKLKYEQPKLVDLSGEKAAYGEDCSGGSSAVGICWGGGSPTNQCLSGNAASTNKCCTGTGPGSTANCQAGNCPQRHVTCSPGGTYCTFGDYAGGSTCEVGT